MFLEVTSMLYNHSEIKNKYKSTYQIRKALENKEIYKILIKEGAV